MEEAEQWIGCGMTYTLFECLKDRLDELTEGQTEASLAAVQSIDLDSVGGSAIKISEQHNSNDADKVKKDPKKEHLTKAQKRRQWERSDHKGERERGWNWVDIVKHLSQTGYKEEKAVTQLTDVLQPLNI